MNYKHAACGLITFLSMFAGGAHAGAYSVEQGFTDESYWTVSYYEDITVNEGQFDVVFDEEAEAVLFSFVSADGMVYDSCIVTPEMNQYVYAKSVELAANLSIVDSYTVYPGVVGDMCAIVDDIEYRADVAEVEFNCEEGYTQLGQSIYVVGNTPLLGNWDPAQAIKLDPIYYPHWQSRLTVENASDIEWKCIVRDEQDTSDVVMWEQGDNNFFNSGDIKYTWGRFIFH